MLSETPPAYALGSYRRAARRAVLACKEMGRRRLSQPFGRQLAVGLTTIAADLEMGREWCVVPAPSRGLTARRRGGSHMLRTARAMVRALQERGWSARTVDCLAIAPGAVDSAALEHAERPSNLAGRIRVRYRRIPRQPASVVLIDDVITTGTTVAGGVHALERAGLDARLVLSLTATEPSTG